MHYEYTAQHNIKLNQMQKREDTVMNGLKNTGNEMDKLDPKFIAREIKEKQLKEAISDFPEGRATFH